MLNKLYRKTRYFLLKLFRIRDSAHSIALGFALGASVNFVPSFGIGLAASVVLAKIARGNAVAGFIGGASFMMTFPFLFYLNMRTGEFIFPQDIGEAIEHHIDRNIEMGLTLGKTFFTGMLLNMLIFITTIYFIIYFISTRYRKRILRFLYLKWVKRKHA
ncbi:uncharacterized protein (DUF2062 family) [Bacillus ectoiniformans]|uniref:DUF2062 domain-containing protein n=1 Tax=Bacillus ectoiniformans TaxID=1494429 RepID=UPI00195C3D3C|nr:DUF2062 domain-containing protein [Bacillus ectoiniformans]MBM7648915.1 uncharacterized protein (DUF2062 family) [Bacillus ectoiniformans]